VRVVRRSPPPRGINSRRPGHWSVCAVGVGRVLLSDERGRVCRFTEEESRFHLRACVSLTRRKVRGAGDRQPRQARLRRRVPDLLHGQQRKARGAGSARVALIRRRKEEGEGRRKRDCEWGARICIAGRASPGTLRALSLSLSLYVLCVCMCAYPFSSAVTKTSDTHDQGSRNPFSF